MTTTPFQWFTFGLACLACATALVAFVRSLRARHYITEVSRLLALYRERLQIARILAANIVDVNEMFADRKVEALQRLLDAPIEPHAPAPQGDSQ